MSRPVPAGFIKANLHNWIAEEITRQAKQRGTTHHVNLVTGLVNDRVKKWIREGTDFYYLDHSYFNRGWGKNMFRCIRNGCHLTEIKLRPDDRLKRFGVEIEPWRKTGRKVVIIPPSDYYVRIWPGLVGWVKEQQYLLEQRTDRPVVVKAEKGGLREYLSDAWAVVCCMSVAGVEAALMGVPVFSTPRCASWPISQSLDRIETPEYPDRYAWASSLAYASWNADEIGSVEWLDYDYALRDDVPRKGV